MAATLTAMIILHTHRQYAQVAHDSIFPYIKLLQQSHANNVSQHSRVSGEWLTVKLINSLLDEIKILLQKKLVNTSSRTVKIKLTDAAAIALYKTFLIIPIDENNYYLHLIRQEWITILDKQIFT